MTEKIIARKDCPCKDADCKESEVPLCPAVHHNGIECTRPAGHVGKHHAHGIEPGWCAGSWSDEE